MKLSVNIITENYYFFLGIKEHLRSEERSVSKISTAELKSISFNKFNKNDVIIFHTSSSIDELSFLISTASFPGKIIFIPTGKKVRLSLAFRNHISLDARADIDCILNEIAKVQEDAKPSLNLMKDKLTRREKAILLHTIEGMDVQSISDFLRISIKTVYAHRRNALNKLGGRNLFEVWPVRGMILKSALSP